MSHSKKYPLDNLPDVPPKLSAKATSGAFPNVANDHMNRIYNQCLDKISEGDFPCMLDFSSLAYETQSGISGDIVDTILERVKSKLVSAGYQVEIYGYSFKIDNPMS
jgi:hypothetical protein